MVHISLDVCMENFWTRPTGVFTKPVWLREGVLQLVFDDDNTELKYNSGPTVPGGHVAFTRTACVYSSVPSAEAAPEITDPLIAASVAALKEECKAFTQRVGSCYLVEANLFGFVNEDLQGISRLGEQRVLSSAVVWAIADYKARYGSAPEHIVLHLDVNGTLLLADIASNKSPKKAAEGMATRLTQRAEKDQIQISDTTSEAIARVKTLDDDDIRAEYNAHYPEADVVRTLHHCLASLDSTPSGSALEACLTLAIRTNGVESAAAATYLQNLIKGALGTDLSTNDGTIGHYVVAHEDRERGLFFHPVLLEKLAKSKGAYSFSQYVDELREVSGKTCDLNALNAVSAGSLKKSDEKFKMYLGLCKSADDKPADYSITSPPPLQPAFAREKWDLPEDVNGYARTDVPEASDGTGSSSPQNLSPESMRLRNKTGEGPWWAGFEVKAPPPPSASWLSASVESVSSRLKDVYVYVTSPRSSPMAQRPPVTGPPMPEPPTVATN